ncbi:hypothetical protein FIV11_04040 [Lactiplantibacillus plantarum]|uniref:hypothetical protein n=1 Tax=Lactiplantibacillus plantarum TaxID=1590 RepID=UPI00264C9017|nr:hypothetical protein [Lactiplantibacillus plantarum]MDN7060899.1 hypothetical protein [Lactiplantibacillus plantarum]
MKKENSDMAGCLFMIIEIPAAWLIQSVGLMLMWGWFISPLFKVSGLGFWQSFGLTMLLAFLGNTGSSKTDTSETAYQGMIKIIAMIVIILIGWLVSLAV